MLNSSLTNILGNSINGIQLQCFENEDDYNKFVANIENVIASSSLKVLRQPFNEIKRSDRRAIMLVSVLNKIRKSRKSEIFDGLYTYSCQRGKDQKNLQRMFYKKKSKHVRKTLMALKYYFLSIKMMKDSFTKIEKAIFKINKHLITDFFEIAKTLESKSISNESGTGYEIEVYDERNQRIDKSEVSSTGKQTFNVFNQEDSGDSKCGSSNLEASMGGLSKEDFINRQSNFNTFFNQEAQVSGHSNPNSVCTFKKESIEIVDENSSINYCYSNNTKSINNTSINSQTGRSDSPNLSKDESQDRKIHTAKSTPYTKRTGTNPNMSIHEKSIDMSHTSGKSNQASLSAERSGHKIQSDRFSDNKNEILFINNRYSETNFDDIEQSNPEDDQAYSDEYQRQISNQSGRFINSRKRLDMMNGEKNNDFGSMDESPEKVVINLQESNQKIKDFTDKFSSLNQFWKNPILNNPRPTRISNLINKANKTKQTDSDSDSNNSGNIENIPKSLKSISKSNSRKKVEIVQDKSPQDLKLLPKTASTKKLDRFHQPSIGSLSKIKRKGQGSRVKKLVFTLEKSRKKLNSQKSLPQNNKNQKNPEIKIELSKINRVKKNEKNLFNPRNVVNDTNSLYIRPNLSSRKDMVNKIEQDQRHYSVENNPQIQKNNLKSPIMSSLNENPSDYMQSDRNLTSLKYIPGVINKNQNHSQVSNVSVQNRKANSVFKKNMIQAIETLLNFINKTINKQEYIQPRQKIVFFRKFLQIIQLFEAYLETLSKSGNESAEIIRLQKVLVKMTFPLKQIFEKSANQNIIQKKLKCVKLEMMLKILNFLLKILEKDSLNGEGMQFSKSFFRLAPSIDLGSQFTSRIANTTAPSSQYSNSLFSIAQNRSQMSKRDFTSKYTSKNSKITDSRFGNILISNNGPFNNNNITHIYSNPNNMFQKPPRESGSTFQNNESVVINNTLSHAWIKRSGRYRSNFQSLSNFGSLLNIKLRFKIKKYSKDFFNRLKMISNDKQVAFKTHSKRRFTSDELRQTQKKRGFMFNRNRYDDQPNSYKTNDIKTQKRLLNWLCKNLKFKMRICVKILKIHKMQTDLKRVQTFSSQRRSPDQREFYNRRVHNRPNYFM